MSIWRKRLIRLARSKSTVAAVICSVLFVATAKRFRADRELPAAKAADLVIGPAATANPTQLNQPAVSDDSLRQWLNQPIEPLNRNVFSTQPEQFAPTAAGGPATRELPGVLSPSEAKSPPGQADGNRGEMVRIEDLRLQASRIRLQSTLMGAMPSALVNGRTVREGDVVASFRVLKIEARRIILEREGIKLEVPLI